MDTIYYYHHPDEIPLLSQKDDQGGFYNPFDLVIVAAAEYDRTGVYPDMQELAARLKTRSKRDIDYWKSLLARGRPKDEDR